MSWDVLIIASSKSPPRMENTFEIDGDDAQEPLGDLPLGTGEEVRQRLTAAVPAVSWKDPAWGILEGDGNSIEFNIGEDEPCTSIMLHIRDFGNEGELLAILDSIANIPGWYCFDITQNQWFHQCSPATGLAIFKSHLDNGDNHVAHQAKPFWKRWLGI